MSEAPRNMTFREYLRVVRERRWLIIITTIVFTAASLIYSIRQHKSYEAEAAIQFRVENVDPVVPISLPGLGPEARATVAARSVTSDPVVRRAQEILHTKQLTKNDVNAQTESGSLLVIVTARSPKPQFAARLANAFARAAVDQTTADVRARYKAAAADRRRVITQQVPPRERALYAISLTRLEELALSAQPAVVTEQADTPTKPVSPNPVRDTVLGFLLGLVVGLIAASVRDVLDRRFASARDIETELNLPIVGYVPEDLLGRTVVNSRGRKPLTSTDLDAVQILVANMELLDIDNRPKLVLVTSALAAEGKSTVAAAMAGASAVLGRHTLLVEGDFRRPQLANRLGLKSSPGLTDYLSGQAALVDVVQRVEFPIPAEDNRSAASKHDQVSVSCIVAGSAVPQPVALLRSEKARQFLETVAASYDMIIVDGTPLLPVADALQLIPSAQAVVMCLRATQTTRAQARAAATLLEHFPDRPAGIVLTGVRLPAEAELYGSSAYAYTATRRK